MSEPSAAPDRVLGAFISAWANLTDDQRSRFVDEWAEDLVHFDLKGRLMPGPGFGMDDEMIAEMDARPRVAPRVRGAQR